MKFYLITKDGVTVDKQVFSGDDEKALQIILDAVTGKTGYAYSETDKQTFEGAPVNIPQNNTQKAWQINKVAGADKAISFLAHILGLE